MSIVEEESMHTKINYFTRWRFVLTILLTVFVFLYLSSVTTFNAFQHPPPTQVASSRKEELDQSKIAVCLVGGARKFELTGPSIVENILKEYPNADLFLHAPLDGDAFKFSYLKEAPRLASIRIFKPTPIPETPELLRLLSPQGSPNGVQYFGGVTIGGHLQKVEPQTFKSEDLKILKARIDLEGPHNFPIIDPEFLIIKAFVMIQFGGLLQYFSLIEGCLTLIKAYQKEKKFTYDWIVRARVDGYWNAPLDPESFVPGQYVVPSGSIYWGLNDRHGIGDFNTSTVALSRFSILPTLVSAGFDQINSECAFKAQFTTQGVPYVEKRLPFCVVTDRRYPFPPEIASIPVAATSSPGPLSGVKCRPCSWVCQGKCVADAMMPVMRGGGWTDWENGTLQLCDPRDEVEKGWEEVFDVDAGEKLAESRKRILGLKLEDCVRDFKEMRRRTTNWDVLPPQEICKLGLGTK